MIEVSLIGAAYFLGLSASMAPCLFPVLPSFTAYIAGADLSRKQAVLSGTMVTLGVMTVFLLFGFLLRRVASSISLINDNYVVFLGVEGLILLAIGILMAAGVKFEFGFLSRLASGTQNLLDADRNYIIQSYLIGIFFTVLAAPCAVLPFSALFILIATSTEVSTVVFVIVVFSLGAGLPFFAMSLLVPEFKDILLSNKEKAYKFLPIVTGLILVTIGIVLVYQSISYGVLEI